MDFDLEEYHFHEQQLESWNKFIIEMNNELKAKIRSELNGENKLFYLIKLEQFILDYFLNFNLINANLQEPTTAGEISFTINTIHQNIEYKLEGYILLNNNEISYYFFDSIPNLIKMEDSSTLNPLFSNIDLISFLQQITKFKKTQFDEKVAFHM